MIINWYNNLNNLQIYTYLHAVKSAQNIEILNVLLQIKAVKCIFLKLNIP